MLITGVVRVLFVNVSVVLRPTKVSVPTGIVTIPEFEIVEIIGVLRVLFCNVSVPARVANVPVALGSVTVAAPFVIVLITGAVNVLFISV